MFFNYFHPADTFGMLPGAQAGPHSTNSFEPISSPGNPLHRTVPQISLGNPVGRQINGLHSRANSAPPTQVERNQLSIDDTTGVIAHGWNATAREIKIITICRKTRRLETTTRYTSRIRDPESGRRIKRIRIETDVDVTQSEEIHSRTIQL